MEALSQPQQPDIESLRLKYKLKFEAIWNAPLYVHNIKTFAESALRAVTNLNEEVVALFPTHTGVEGEDYVYRELELPNLNSVLDRIVQKQHQIENIEKYISEQLQNASRILMPTKPAHIFTHTGTDTGFTEHQSEYRLLTLMYILENDFALTQKDIQIIPGSVSSEMMRREPYVQVFIPQLKRVVYVCDEIGNTTFIFDTEKLHSAGITIDQIDFSRKPEIQKMLSQHPDIGRSVDMSNQWRSNLSMFLSSEIPEYTTVSREVASEFEQKKFLTLSEFKTEIKEVWDAVPEADRPTSISTWYIAEQKKHTNTWPSSLRDIYGMNFSELALHIQDVTFDEANGLYIDSDKQRWGSMISIAQEISGLKEGLYELPAFIDLLKKCTIKKIRYVNRPIDNYNLEQVRNLVAQHVELSGYLRRADADGLYIDTTDNTKWGSRVYISKLIANNVDMARLKSSGGKKLDGLLSSLPHKKIFVHPSLCDAYNVQEVLDIVKKDPHLSAYRRRANEDFVYVDENKKEWASLSRILQETKIYGLLIPKIRAVIKDLVTQKILIGHRLADAYNMDDVLALLKTHPEFSGYFKDTLKK